MNYFTTTTTEGVPMPTLDNVKLTRQQALSSYSINIEFLSIGCIIRVGCKSIPFQSVEEAMTELNEYVKNPLASGKKWREKLGE
jgi:hypothetical protein